MPSMLDRLTDPDAGGGALSQGYDVAQLTRAVLRDLEELLNTRMTAVDVPPECKEVAASIVTFGLPDFSSVPAATTQQRADIGRLLETIIMRHEPRLRDVKATLVESTERTLNRAVRFLLAGRLRVDPAPEVAFDTILELTTGHAAVKSAGGE